MVVHPALLSMGTVDWADLLVCNQTPEQLRSSSPRVRSLLQLPYSAPPQRHTSELAAATEPGVGDLRHSLAARGLDLFRYRLVG